MNHKLLFFLSATIIAVGITGIFLHQEPAPKNESQAVNQGEKKKVIVIAETLREIKPHHILNEKDYQIRTVEISEDSQDIRDISSLGINNLNGYLVLTHLPANSAILPDRVESPDSKTFALHSLADNELPYDYRVQAQDESLLSALSVGDQVSLYIRLMEKDPAQKNNAGIASEVSSGPGNSRNKYALSRLTGPLSIIEIRKDKNLLERAGYSQGETVGSIVLRISREQLAQLRVVENAGEILLFPADNDRLSDKQTRTDNVLTQFRTVKELRGDQ